MQKAVKRALVLLIILLIVIAGVAVLLPSILSAGPVRRAVLSSISRRLKGTLGVDAWSLSWRSGMRFTGVSFEDGAGGTALEADSVTIAAGLLDLLRAEKHLGRVDVVSPDFRWTSPGPAPVPRGEGGAKASPVVPRVPPAPPADTRRVLAREPVVRMPDVRGQVSVHGGRLLALSHDGRPSLVIEAVNGELELSGPHPPPVRDLSGRQKARSGGGAPTGSGEWTLKGSLALTWGDGCEPGEAGRTACGPLTGAKAREAVTLAAEGDFDNHGIRVRSLLLRSQPLTVAGSGSLTDLNGDRRLELSGTLTPDVARLAAIAWPAPPISVLFEGKEPGPFTLRTRLAGGPDSTLLDRTEAEADVRLSTLKIFGIDARDVDAGLRLRQGRLQVELKAWINEGTLSAAPVFDFSGNVPALVISESTPLLKGVKLTDDMMSEVMTLVSPVLRTSGVLGGRVDVRLEPCRLVLGPASKRDAAFSAGVTFWDVWLAPSDSLAELLEWLKLDARAVAVSNETVQVACEGGWIRPGTLTLLSGQHVLRLSGAVALDGRLKYTAEVPVTEAMVGKDVYAYVKDISLKLPIGGTIAKPQISKRSYFTMLGNLVQDARSTLVLDQGKQLLDKFLLNVNRKRTENEEPGPPGQAAE